MKHGFGTRIFLFLLTNLAVLVVFGVVIRLIGVERILYDRGVSIDYTALLIFAGVLGFLGAFVSLLMSKWIAKTFAKAKVIERPSSETEVWLVATVKRLAEQAGIGMPEVAIFPSPEPNAFATGARRNKALVAVSVGLLQSMDREEVEAVLAHEVSHVANGDMITMALLQGVLNTFVIFVSRIVGFFVDRVLLRNERGHGIGYWVSVIAAEILLGILASIIAMWFSRRREFRADAGAAKLVGAPPMISALRRLQSRYEAPTALPDSLAAFGIRGARSGAGFRALFRSHPSIDERIAALSQ